MCLLAYDQQQAPVIRNTVDINLFGGPHRMIVARIYEYIDRYKKPPGDHLPDLLEDKLKAENKREASLYEDVILSLHEAYPSLNSEYVMAQLNTFVRRQSLRSIAVELAKELQRDTEESLDNADTLIHKAQHATVNLFDPGTRLSNKERALAFLDIPDTSFPIGIPDLDKRGFGPTRKEQWLFIANAKKGKSWALMHLAKMALVHKLKVCHISLEMSEARTSQRYFQTLFAMSKRKEVSKAVKFKRDSLNRIAGFENVKIKPKLSMDDQKIHARLSKKIDEWSVRMLDNIIVKQFPTGQLTVNQLKAYLDTLDNNERFVPDLLIVDYPDLMKLDKNNYRLAIDETYKDLRGIAVERNIALAIVSQSHRGAAKAKVVGSENVAEAYSKIAHADVIITYSQTEIEQSLGLARLHVAGGRNDQDNITIVISQNYALGQFVVDSAIMRGNYWENLPEGEQDAGDED